MYELDTRTPVGVSGSTFVEIHENCATAEISEDDALSFLTGPRILHNYFILVKDGLGKFIPKGQEILNQSAKKIFKDNIVRDLDNRAIFFDRMFVEYQIADNELTLSIENSPEESIAFLETVTIKSSLICNLYFTEKCDPTKLLSKVTIDLNELRIHKNITLTMEDTNVSIWGSKKILCN